jgi:hypothetical protein
VLSLGIRIEHVEGGYTRDRKFVLKVRSSADAALGEDGGVKKDVGALMSSATSLFEVKKVVEDDIKALIAKAISVDIREVHPAKPLFDYGGRFLPCLSFLCWMFTDVDITVNSIQAVEIRNRALKNMRSDISIFDVLSAMPLADVAAKIAGKSSLVCVGAGEDEESGPPCGMVCMHRADEFGICVKHSFVGQ